MIIKAISADIYRDSSNYDCSNDGISTRFDEILVAHPQGNIEVDVDNIPENFCKIVVRDVLGMKYKHVEPLQKPEHIGWMYGGCIVHSSDGRWSQIAGYYPLKLHDRQEE